MTEDRIPAQANDAYTHPLRSAMRTRRESLLAVIAIQVLVPIMCFWVFLMRDAHFSVDGYINWFSMDYDVHMRNGRPVSWAITRLENLLGVSPLHHCILSTLLFMGLLAVIGTLVTSMIVQASSHAESVGYAAGMSLAMSLSFANMFIWEWYTFVEALPFYGAGLICVGLSVGPLLRRDWKSLLLAVTLISLATMSYQIVMPIAGIWAVIIVLVANGYEISMKTFKEGMRCVIGSVAGGAVGIAVPHLMESAGLCTLYRGGEFGIEAMLANGRSLISFQKSLWVDGMGLFPRWSVLLLVGLALACLMYGWISSGRGVSSLISLLAVLLGCYVFAIVLHLAVDTFWPAPRTLEPVACAWSALLACAFGVCYEATGKRVDESKGGEAPSARRDVIPALVAVAVCALTLVVHARSSWGATQEHFKANDSEAEWGRAVAREISEHELDTGDDIVNVVYGNDENPTYALVPPLTYTCYGINMRAVPVEWATPYIIEYYGDIDFESSSPMDEETKDRIFGDGRDDIEFDESQIAYDGDTAYVLVY